MFHKWRQNIYIYKSKSYIRLLLSRIYDFLVICIFDVSKYFTIFVFVFDHEQLRCYSLIFKIVLIIVLQYIKNRCSCSNNKPKIKT